MSEVINFSKAKEEKNWDEFEKIIKKYLLENETQFSSEDINIICKRMKEFYLTTSKSINFKVKVPEKIINKLNKNEMNKLENVLKKVNQKMFNQIRNFTSEILLERLQLEVKLYKKNIEY